MDKFSIGVLAQLTGVSASTLRAWERRYGVLHPVRSDGGHRLYTAADVATVNRLNTFRREGLALQRAIQMLRDENRPPPPDASVLDKASRRDGDTWAGYHDYVVDAIARFSFADLDACYTTLLAIHPPDLVAERLLMPVLRTVGGRWDTHPGGIAEEHFLAAYLRNRLGGHFLHACRTARGPQLVLACLDGDWHELGLLHFAVVLTARAMRPLYLGPHLPVSEVAAIVEHMDCVGVVLSGTVVSPGAELSAGLTRLARRLAVPVFVGGPVSDRFASELDRCGVIPVGSDYGDAAELIQELTP